MAGGQCENIFAMVDGDQSRWWWWFLAACVAIRTAIPLAVLAAQGRALPGLPQYEYGPFYGDANGYYATARELVSAVGRGAVPLAIVLVVGIAAVVLAARRLGARNWVVLLLAGCVASAATVVLILKMYPAGSPAIGWSLLWALPLTPLRVLDPGLNPDVSFGVGLVLSLLAIGVTVIATAFAGFWASGRRAVGAVAAAAFTLWPFVPGLVVGPRGWGNGTWLIDAGLGLYAEPLSTALVIGAVALLLRRHTNDLLLAVAGLSLGFATVTKLTNGLIVVGLVAVVAWSKGLRSALLLTASSLVLAPVVLVYWAKGYASTYDGALSVSNNVWSLSHVRSSWGDSLLFTPVLLLLLVPLAAVGAVVLSGRARAMLLVPIGLTVVTYSCYRWTSIHPRFFYVVLPLVFVLDAAGICAIASWVAGAFRSIGSRSVSDGGVRETSG
jgi:hypothetical protein